MQRLDRAIKILSDVHEGSWLDVAEFDAAFGSDFVEMSKKLSGDDTTKGLIYFRENPPPVEGRSALLHGWRLVVEFDADGEVRNYYLTNRHK